MVKKLIEKGYLKSVDLSEGVISAVMQEGFLKDRKIRILLPHDDNFLNWFAGQVGTLPGRRKYRTVLIAGKNITEHKITIIIE